MDKCEAMESNKARLSKQRNQNRSTTATAIGGDEAMAEQDSKQRDMQGNIQTEDIGQVTGQQFDAPIPRDEVHSRTGEKGRPSVSATRKQKEQIKIMNMVVSDEK